MRSERLEVIERFAARAAAKERLAGGRPEFGEPLGIQRSALRARDLALREAHRARRADGQRPRRRDPVGLQLRPAGFGDRVRRPRRGEHHAHGRLGETARGQRRTDVGGDDFGGGTARIGRRDVDLHSRAIHPDGADDAQFAYRHDGNLRVGDAIEQRPGLRDARVVGAGHQREQRLRQRRERRDHVYHWPPGKARCRNCISAST